MRSNPCRIIKLGEEPEFVGRAVCAIGVFDGVHLGHRALIGRAAELADEIGVEAYAVTFDRDPDQIITPESAAPQLISLEQKARRLCDAGVSAVLIVPFTPQIASMSAEEFLSEVLLSACDPVAIVVGEDFRFGRKASGSVDTLRAYCTPRKIEVEAMPLVFEGGHPVTSTRIRSLVADGDVQGAQALLKTPHRVDGVVVRGRGEGAELGVPTANIAPAEFAALPAAGVYAGRVEVAGATWPAAISVGRPPTFPEAVDVLEAHLVGFAGDIYDEPVSVELLAKLRDQRRFASVDELVASMRADIATAGRIVGLSAQVLTGEGLASVPQASDEDWDFDEGYLDDGAPVVEDPEALLAAERAVAMIDPSATYAHMDSSWVEVLAPAALGSLMGSGGVNAFMITSPLSAAGIPFAWKPFPPEAQQNVRPDFNYWQRFSLWVPPEYAREARAALGG